MLSGLIIRHDKVLGIQEGKGTKKIDYRHTTRQKSIQEDKATKGLKQGRIETKKGTIKTRNKKRLKREELLYQLQQITKKLQQIRLKGSASFESVTIGI